MNAPAHTTGMPTELQNTIDQWLHAVVAQDIDGIVSHYAEDIVAFDAVGKLQFVGKAAYRDHWIYCMTHCPMEGPMIFEPHRMQTEVSDRLAVVHALCRCGGRTAEGEEKASWMRMTAAYRKTPTGWVAFHEHFSAPFDMDTGAVLFDLQPEASDLH